jgi:hypothetical protein
MPRLTEEKIACDFPATWNAVKYDDWSFYRKQFQLCADSKAVDFLGLDPANSTLWLIELKDYRQFQRSKDESIWEEVAIKARDTLAGLFAAIVSANDVAERVFAQKSVMAGTLRVVLHLEQPSRQSKLFPRAFNPANVEQKMKQLVKPIDAHPCVVELNRMHKVPWTAQSIP